MTLVILSFSLVQAIILTLAHQLDITPGHQISKRNTIEKIVDLYAQVLPQMVCQTNLTVLTVPLSFAAGGIQGFTDCLHHLRERDVRRLTRQAVPTPRTTDAAHQFEATQLGKKLFQIRQRNPLPGRNISQTHWTLLAVERKIQHRRYRIAAFGRQSHSNVRPLIRVGSAALAMPVISPVN